MMEKCIKISLYGNNIPEAVDRLSISELPHLSIHRCRAKYDYVEEKGTIVTGAGLRLEEVEEDIIVFHAGTKFQDNNVVTNGGRVLNICAEGKDLQSVRSKLYKAAEVINFDGKYYRKDIGLI